MNQVHTESTLKYFDLKLPPYDAKHKENNIPQSIISQELERKLMKTMAQSNCKDTSGACDRDEIEMEIKMGQIIIQAFQQLYYKYIGHYKAVFMINISGSDRQCLVELFDTEYYRQHLHNNSNGSIATKVSEGCNCQDEREKFSKIERQLQKLVGHNEKKTEQRKLLVWLLRTIIDNFERSVFEVSRLVSGAYLRLKIKH